MTELPETFVPGFHDENEVRKMKYRKFGNTGLTVSQLSLGTGGFSEFFGGYDLEQCKATVREAVRRGINYIDTAPFYGFGTSEEILGKCLDGIPRKAYYLATKVGWYENDLKNRHDFSAKKTRDSIDTSLKRLGVDYVDVLQIHSIEAASPDVIYNETLPALEEIQKQGKAKFLGLTAYPIDVLADYIKKSKVKLDTVLSFMCLSLVDQSLNEYIPGFNSKNLAIINAAPHCLGLLTNPGPQPWHPASQDVKDICSEAREYCKKNNIEIGKFALHYALNEEGPHTVLVGMNTPEILRINMDVCQNGLSDSEKKVYDHVKNQILRKIPKPIVIDWGAVKLD